MIKSSRTTCDVECGIQTITCMENSIKTVYEHEENNVLICLIFITDPPSLNLFFKFLHLFNFLFSFSSHAHALNKPPLSLLPQSIWEKLWYKEEEKARGQLREIRHNEACFMCQSSWAAEWNSTNNSSTPGSKYTHDSLLYTRGKATLFCPR